MTQMWRARTVMIQGTGSHVGKSVITAALCRWFVQRGRRVAPFKAQNMSNNSCVTPDGKEIGRAQALQAVACRLTPRTDFNPVLIKPSGHCHAQLVVNGVVAGNLTPSDWGSLRREHFPTVYHAFERLATEFHLVVLEEIIIGTTFFPPKISQAGFPWVEGIGFMANAAHSDPRLTRLGGKQQSRHRKQHKEPHRNTPFVKVSNFNSITPP